MEVKKVLRITTIIASAAVVALTYYRLLGGEECSKLMLKEPLPEIEAMYRFDDLNDKHLKHARSIGIAAPLNSIEQISSVKNQLCKLRTCRHYRIAHLTHSHSYLIPEAAQLLKEIGRDFKRRLRHGGYHPHKIVVTSLLRTKADVARLMATPEGINAKPNSAHLYGTTFDISYANFSPWFGWGKVPSKDVLAHALGETLHELRSQGRCLVKYERHTDCYHITVCVK